MSARKSPSFSDEKEQGFAHEAVAEFDTAEHAPEAVIVKRYGRLGPILERMFAHGVEARGVERVPEDERSSKNMYNK